MPFRTKDYFLFLLTVAFLVVGITLTAKSDLSEKTQSATVINFDSSNEEVIFAAVLPEEKPDGRSSRLALLREKISNLVIETVTEPEPDVVEPEPTLDENLSTTLNKNEVDLCPNYQLVATAWSAKDLRFEVVEGARIVYRNVEVPATVDELGQPVAVQQSREVVLQLPLRSFSSPNKNCLNTDVIGVAIDGSLIRNNEHNLYKVFGSETLIGYSLDGFSIYGINDLVATDECGGAVAGGEYRYYLSTKRAGVLGCYSGVPINI